MSLMNAGDPMSGLERLFWEKAPIPALQCQPDGQCLDANESAIEFFGLKLSKLRERTLMTLAVKSSQPALNQFLEKCASGAEQGAPEVIAFQCHDRSLRRCWVSGRALVSDVDAFSGTSLLLQFQAEQSKEVPQPQSPDSKLHHANDAIFVIDMNHRVQFWNAGSKRIFEWDEKEIIGAEITGFMFSNTPDIAPLLDSLRDIEHWSGEIGASTKSGEHKNIEARFNLLKDGEGRLEGILAIVTIDEHFSSIDVDLDTGRYIQITVDDDGEGMENSIKDKIFKPFFTTRPVGRGSGLGLTNVLGIVKSFNGFIQSHSQPGQGTKFDIFLPAIFEDESEHPVYDPADYQGSGETILIVDDEGAVRDTTQKLLVQNGYKTLKAVDGVDAVAVYGRNQDQIKIVITDLKMPNMDGISLVRILRNMNPGLPILVVSGHPDEHDVELLEPCSSIQVLEKPHKSSNLLHWVHQLLHQDEVRV